MLKPNLKLRVKSSGYSYAIIASRYHARYVEGMLRAAKSTLGAAGARWVTVIRVPGAFEIPLVASQLALAVPNAPDAILCLGVIIQGETAHAEHIGLAITDALMRIQLRSGVPCVHEVLLVKDEAQARARCLDAKTNRGTEAAQTAMAMVKVMKRLCPVDDVPF